RVLAGMLKARWLTANGEDYAVTRRGEGKLAELGVDLAAARSGRRAFARGCVDLTQRRLHLSGALAAALLDVYVRRGWVQRSPRSRIVSITPKGRAGFRQWFAA